jgi:RNA polymerase sigma-70 factor (ECF subfamily)
MKVFSYVLYKVRTYAVAEDITSDAFLKLFKELQQNSDVEKYSVAWLYRVASNLIVDYKRSSYYNKTSTETEEQEKRGMHSDSESNDSDVFISEYNDQLQALSQDEAQKFVLESLVQLQQEDQEVIELRLYQELPFKEIAVILESTEGAVKMKYGRAIEKLKVLVDKRYG